MSCSVKCSGFDSIRPECEDNACLANGLCFAVDPTIKARDCADWCCVSHSATAVWLVVLFCAAVFFGAAGYYLRRLHQVNVKSGAVKPGQKTTTAAAASGAAAPAAKGAAPQVDYR
jgi:hypothetical protein